MVKQHVPVQRNSSEFRFKASSSNNPRRSLGETMSCASKAPLSHTVAFSSSG